MKLIPISERLDHVQILWDLLLERTPEQSISHKGMPTPDDHKMFVLDHAPYIGSLDSYRDWSFIEDGGVVVGSIYLTDRMEIGVSVFRDYQRQGYATAAVRRLMDDWASSRPFLANINPANEASKRMWEKLGFTKIQETYASEH